MNNTPRFCPHCGSPLNPGTRFCGRCGAAVQSAPPAAPGPGPAAGPSPAYAPQASPLPPAPSAARPRKSRRGCVGCLVAALLVVLLVGCGVLVWQFLPRESDAMALGHRQKVATQAIAPTGGTLVVDDPENPIAGLTLIVPPGAYPDETSFTVSVRPIEDHALGPDFNPVTPLIHVDNGHRYAAEPMRVEIPIHLAAGEFAMAFFYDVQTGKLEGIPPLALEADRLTVLTSHFSDMVVTRVDMEQLKERIVDTGFRPGVDDWQFVNRGSIVAPNGHCAGQSISAMWYYVEQRLGAGEPALYGRFDNNRYGFKSPALQQDDSWGQRLASSVQRKTDWDAKTRTLSNYLGGVGDWLTWNAFLYSMALTGEPQYVSIGRYVTNAEGKEEREGHALVAFKIEPGRLYVADPNYPGQASRQIVYQDGAFQPYSSGANARVIEEVGPSDFTEFRYMAKSALIDWEQVGALYADMLDGQAGKGVFPRYLIRAATGKDEESGEIIWSDFPTLLEMDEAQTAKVHEDMRGKLLLWVETDGQHGNFRVTMYNQTQNLGILAPGEGDAILVPWYILKPGVNHVGIWTEIPDKDGVFQYNDFWRIKVIYGRPDLSGSWEGTWRIEEADKAKQYIKDWLVRFLMMTGLPESEAKAREAVDAAVTESPDMRQDRPLGMVLEAPEGGIPATGPVRYAARIVYLDSYGEQREIPGEVIYDQGAVRFSFGQDAAGFEFVGELGEKDTLSGDFVMNAWGVVKGAGSGVWQLSRAAP
jgi:hypothetical protein